MREPALWGNVYGLTLPATLAFVSASIGLSTALLTFGLSSAPGWRELRWFALSATFAALYSLSNVPATLSVGLSTELVASRLTDVFAGLHLATLFKAVAAHEDRTLSRSERAIVVVIVSFSALGLVPGLVVEDRIAPRYVAFLHVAYADAPPTSFGAVVVTCFVAAIGSLFVRALRRRLRGQEPSTAWVVALGAEAGGAVHDALASTDVIRSPYVLDLSLLVLVVAIGGVIVSRFLAAARALERSSHELEAAHKELVRKERLAALGELAAMVAHEVRNPLAVVFNATAGLRRAQPGSPDHGALVEIVQEEAERLRDIVSELLDFARPRAPELALSSLDDIVREAVDAARSGVGVPESDVLLEHTAAVAHVPCDARLVRQAVVNLVTNALQTGGRRGPVVVSITDPSPKRIAVRVSDDGPGIEEELRDRIFTPFFSTRPKGTGLGLTIVRRCADAHGGEIVLRSTPGGGATFELQLPRGDV